MADRLRAVGARVDVDPADEPLKARVGKAKVLKIPYILVVGDDDVAAGTVGVNRRGSNRPERGVELTPSPRCSSARWPSVASPNPR